MIADVGGFLGAFTILISFIGTFFSEFFFRASVTENFFIRALSQEEIKDKKVHNVKDIISMFYY